MLIIKQEYYATYMDYGLINLFNFVEVENMEDTCKLCKSKLEKKEGDALFYCMKCSEKIAKDKRLKELMG